MMRAHGILAVALLLGACDGGEPRPVRLEIGSRGSCGSSTLTYDISCVQELRVQLLGEDRKQYRSACTNLGGRFGSLQELIASDTVIDLLVGVRAREAARIEVRAYNSLDRDLCTDLEDRDADLMLWGRSDVIDFSDPSVDEVRVELECRPSCDCAHIDPLSPECPRELVPGVCVRPANVYCRKPCETSATCYDGALTCGDDGTCPLSAPCCTNDSGGTCAECADDSECGDGRRCVVNDHSIRQGDPAEAFCAESCPPLPDVTPCPSGWSCQRLGTAPYLPPGAGNP